MTRSAIGRTRPGVRVRAFGVQLDDGQAALVMFGKSRVGELDKALTRAEMSEEREIEPDGKELAKEARRGTQLARRETTRGDRACVKTTSATRSRTGRSRGAPMRLAVLIPGVGDVRRGGEGPDRAAS
jgi:hypothetical protein